MTVKPSEPDVFWKSLREDREKLREKLESLRAEAKQFGDLYENCRNLWIRGDFKGVSENLDKEGFRFFHELQERVSELRNGVERVLKDMDMVNKDLREGVDCPRCGGVGSIVTEKHYERSEEQIVPIIKTEKCPLCNGSGKLQPPN